MASLKLAHQNPPQSAPDGCLAFIADDGTREVVESVLLNEVGANAVVESGGIASALRTLRPDEAPQLLIVDISGAADAASDIAALMSITDVQTRVIAIGTENDVSLFRNLLAVGVSDYLVKPVERRAVQAAITSARRSASPAETESKRGQVNVFFGTRGGLGTTTAAVNTAYIIAREQGKKVALVDLDLHFGTIALSLGLEAGGGLREALETPERIDGLFIERAMTRPHDNLMVLSAEESLASTLMFDPSSLRVLLPALQEKFDVLIIDLPRGMGAMQRHVLSAADKIVVFAELSLAGVRDAHRIKTLLAEIARSAQVSFIASGAQSAKIARVRPADFQQNVGQKLAYTVPFESKSIALATSAAKPLVDVAKNCEPVKVFRSLATELAGPPAAPKSRNLLHWFRS